MWQGQRIVEGDAEEASAGGEHVVLLDVRNEKEWEEDHAPSATWVPLSELEGARFKLPINRRIVCVCRVGSRSAKAAAELVQMGFDAVNMTGGMKSWEAQGLPVVKDDGSPGEII